MSVAIKLRPLMTRATTRAASFLSHHPALRAASVVLVAAFAHYAARYLLSPAIFFNAGWVVYWPLHGIAIAIMLMVPRSYWPWILTGTTLSEALSHHGDEGWLEMSCDAVANVLEVAIPAYTLPAFRNLTDWMGQKRLITRFILFALILGPLVSSIPSSFADAYLHQRTFWSEVIRWSFADALGATLWLPLVLAMSSREIYDLFRWRALGRTLALIGLTGASSWVVFYTPILPLPFIIMPTLLLVAFQLGFSGAVLAVNLLTIIVSAATLHGHGPFSYIPDGHVDYRVPVLQLYLGLCMLMSLPISVLLLQRRQFELQLKDAYFRMEAVAIQDGLTGLANRRRFDAAMETEWRRARRQGLPLTLLMIDVDYFKPYNDTYGHVAGDECLRQVAAALTRIPSRAGDLVARYGGEEFAVLLPGDDSTGALRIAEFTRSAIEALGIEHRASPRSVITVSVGCGTLVPDPELDSFTLIEGADRALYLAKQEGRNCVRRWTPTSTEK